MLLILHFQRILTKHCCSVGPTKQRTLGSLLTSWVHGDTPVLTLSRGWDRMWCPHSLSTHQPRDPKRPSLEGVGMCSHGSLALTQSTSNLQITHGQFSRPTPSLPSTTSAADTEVPCPAMPLLSPSTKTTVPLKIICLMLTLPQAYANLLWTVHLQPPSH